MKNIMIFILIDLSLCLATIPLETTPYWSSPAIPSTASLWGTFFADITNDGYPEIIIVGEQIPAYLFANDSGVISTTPSWQSNGPDVSIWASFGDYDNDGDQDIAVASYYAMGGMAKVYKNDSGTLTADPVWSAGSGDWGEWGDFDNDGDLDLAMCDLFVFPQVYRNNNGVLETTPCWTAIDHNIDFGGAWIDVDSDGDLDLAIAGQNFQEPVLRIYYNDSGDLEADASWSSQVDPNYYTGAIPSVGDVDKDGWMDIAAPMGLLYDLNANAIYKNVSGELEQMPSWFSNDTRMSTSSALGDINGDGFLDWAVNNQEDYCVIYENDGGTMNHDPTWLSNTTGGLGIDLGDVDQDGVKYRADTLTANGTKKLFYLSVLPLHRLQQVTINGDSVPVRDYCYSTNSGWISFKDSIPAGSQVIIKYYHSIDLELLQSDYTNGQAHLFKNNCNVIAESGTKTVGARLDAFPNPFSNQITIKYMIHDTRCGIRDLKIYDATGQLVKSFDPKACILNRESAVIWDGSDDAGRVVPAGIYFCRLQYGEKGEVKKLIKVR